MDSRKVSSVIVATGLSAVLACGMVGCAGQGSAQKDAAAPATTQAATAASTGSAEQLRARLDIVEDFRPDLYHGSKPAENQRYIVMHDTELKDGPKETVDFWVSNGNLVGSQFVVGKDGHIVQCIPLDTIAHHAGYGNTGHNEKFGITEDGRDDLRGTKPGNPETKDYAMNAWSVGIEMVHDPETDTDYPEEQLAAVDGLIAYIDAYFGKTSDIIDHKSWRLDNTDCSAAFQKYLTNYQDHRTHN